VKRGEGERGEVLGRTAGALPFIATGGGEEVMRRGDGH
jgi:hypothetical protein